MAGRGTDIQLGGNLDMRIQKEAEGLESAERAAKIEEIKAQIAEAKAKALEAGGLMVIGTERHESRRIDNQLRGRSGRQGGPGHSTTSGAAVRAVRAIRAIRPFSCRFRTI